ncbi:unnamed protein product [Symbiodinium natans]|uniref:Uncharacterized protein n=1 Tax=Symbiodinium natans TaxID=878477 RepID=A0A812SVM0_9DINO|nr:unnamed protein product [Symbiodinium natans]
MSKAMPTPMLASAGLALSVGQPRGKRADRRLEARGEALGEDRVRMEAEKAQLAVVKEHMLEKADDWNLSMEDIEAAAQLMVSDGQSLPTKLDKRAIMLLFLYAKGVLRQEVSEARKAKLAALLLPDDIYEQSLQRLERLVLEGEKSESLLDDSNSFTYWTHSRRGRG